MRMWQRTTGVQGAERIFVRRGCRWLGVWLAWVSVLSAFGQGRPDIVWMQGGHALSITGVAYSSNAYSPNGDFIVSGSFDRTIKVWRVSDGALIRTLTGHIDYIHCVALSPDGTLIASGGARQNGSGVARVRWHAGTHAHGAHWKCQQRRLLAYWQSARVGERRPNHPRVERLERGAHPYPDGTYRFFCTTLSAASRSRPIADFWSLQALTFGCGASQTKGCFVASRRIRLGSMTSRFRTMAICLPLWDSTSGCGACRTARPCKQSRKSVRSTVSRVRLERAYWRRGWRLRFNCGAWRMAR